LEARTFALEVRTFFLEVPPDFLEVPPRLKATASKTISPKTA
jgi:hypothetical protein